MISWSDSNWGKSDVDGGDGEIWERERDGGSAPWRGRMETRGWRMGDGLTLHSSGICKGTGFGILRQKF